MCRHLLSQCLVQCLLAYCSNTIPCNLLFVLRTCVCVDRQHADAEHSTHSMLSSDQEGLSGNSTPRTGAGAGATAAKATVRAAAPATAAKGAAAGRKALKEALKSQALAKKSSQAAAATSTTGAGAAAVSGGGLGAGAGGGHTGASAAAEDDIDALLG